MNSYIACPVCGNPMLPGEECAVCAATVVLKLATEALEKIATWNSELDGDPGFTAQEALAKMGAKRRKEWEYLQIIRVGGFALAETEPGKFWLSNIECEGLETSADKIESMLAEFFRKEF